MTRRSARVFGIMLLALFALSACAQATPQASPPATGAPVLTPTPTAEANNSQTVTRAAGNPTAATRSGTMATAATTAARGTTTATPGGNACAPGIELLGYSDALDKATFDGTTVGGLSGLVYDARRDRYLSLVDNERETPARVYTLQIPLADGRLGTPTVEAMTILRDERGQPFTGRSLDGEGLALLPGGDLLVASETEPSVRHFAPDGRLLKQVPLPARFGVRPRGEAIENQTFESATLTPDGATFYTATEGPLGPDGFATPARARLRLLRYDGGPDFAPTGQFFYLAEIAQGLSDIAALGTDDLLTLERGFLPGLGNIVRLYRVALAGQPDVTGRASLADADLTPVPKTLLADLGLCPVGGATHPGRQSNPLLDNIESVTLGPRLPDGRQTLLLQSDDNFGADQVTRIYALAWRP